MGQVADYTQVKPGTVRKWVKEGRITAYRVGGQRLRIDRASLDGVIQPR